MRTNLLLLLAILVCLGGCNMVKSPCYEHGYENGYKDGYAFFKQFFPEATDKHIYKFPALPEGWNTWVCPPGRNPIVDSTEEIKGCILNPAYRRIP